MKFARVHLENWRNFTSVDVHLQRRVFLAGPNASGKSNFLDAFRFLRDVASVGGGLRKAVDDRGGVSKIRCLAARRYSDIIIQVETGEDIDNPNWAYFLRFSQDNLRRPVIKGEIVKKQREIILARPDDDDKHDIERLTQTHLEQVSANKNFREVAEFFASIHYIHIVPQLVREPDRSIGRKNDPYGGDFLEQLVRTPEKTLKSRLKRINNVFKVAVPQFIELKLVRDEKGTPHLEGLYEHWRPKAGWQMEDQFSDGTLRLLGLLWAVLDGTSPLLLEEPELSLHPEVVRHVPQMFARLGRKTGRQIIVSTHSVDLLQDSGIAPDEVLILNPGDEGTSVTNAKDDEQIIDLLESGITIADIVIPKTAPKNTSQLFLSFVE
ncbi:MAG: AAA family ATPase [bacterium]